MIEGGKVAPEIFDKAFNETPKAYYLQAEKDLDACLETVANLDTLCDDKLRSLGNDWAGFGTIKKTLTEVRQAVHTLLEKKREKEPDPVEEVPVEQPPSADVAPSAEGAPSLAGVCRFHLRPSRQIAARPWPPSWPPRLFCASMSPKSSTVSAFARLRWGEFRSSVPASAIAPA